MYWWGDGGGCGCSSGRSSNKIKSRSGNQSNGIVAGS